MGLNVIAHPVKISDLNNCEFELLWLNNLNAQTISALNDCKYVILDLLINQMHKIMLNKTFIHEKSKTDIVSYLKYNNNEKAKEKTIAEGFGIELVN